MTPEASCPMMTGGMRRPEEPSKPWTSLPQIPHECTRIRTSLGVIAGAGSSWSTKDLYSLRTRAFIEIEPSLDEPVAPPESPI